jgi:hypothetical protein
LQFWHIDGYSRVFRWMLNQIDGPLIILFGKFHSMSANASRLMASCLLLDIYYVHIKLSGSSKHTTIERKSPQQLSAEGLVVFRNLRPKSIWL